MSTETARKLFNDAWLSVEIPSAISEQFQIFGMISDSDGSLRRVANDDQFALWIKGLNPHVDRKALGVLLSGDFVEMIPQEGCRRILQAMVDNFLEKAEAFNEGGVLPEPKESIGEFMPELKRDRTAFET